MLKREKLKNNEKLREQAIEEFIITTEPPIPEEGVQEEKSQKVMSHEGTPIKEKEKDKTNREIIHVTYLFIGLFVLVLGYFIHFMVTESTEVINNPYNQRQDLLAEQIIRGDILSSDGEILAHTKVESDGTETRIYPYGSTFTHIVGRFNKGKTGLESLENFHLLTSNTNSINKVFSELSGDKNRGDNVVTTLDSNLQQVAYDALGNYKGAVVVMEPSTGKILAMVSKPDYDPNKIDSLWSDLVEDSNNDSALLNRATQGLYPPGSTFKILTAIEYMKENPNYEEYTYDCDGEITINDMTIHCYNNKAHGEVNLSKSFAKSCNSSFAHIGTTLNIKSFRELCNSFLFNSDLPTNLLYNRSSFVLNTGSGVKEVPQTTIGQGKTQVTPLHNALIVSTIANSGIMMKPYVVDHIENTNGAIIKKYLPKIDGTIITPGQADAIASFMAEAVNNGTASALSGKNYTAAGKTGSADHNENEPAHAWFVGFAPVDNPKIVVSIIVESVGTGSDYAVPIAAKIFDAYLGD